MKETQQPPLHLPPLREDLILNPGPMAENGAPTWTIHDPSSNRFFRIGWSAFEILSRWSLGTPKAIATAVSEQTMLTVTPTDVEALYRHLASNMFFQVTGRRGLAFLLQQYHVTRVPWEKRLLKNYLFFRIPLIHPDRILSRCLPWVQWVYSPSFLIIVLFSAVLALLLTLRQWDYFQSTLIHSLSSGDILPYGIALIASKSLHELAHAFTAKRYGCRVPVMGVAILLLWPVLFTETSEVWKLPKRSQRMAVGAAGVLAELALAVFATLAWNLLDDGAVRHAAFFLASVTWILTLVVNLNPFMRFDGYYLLSDLLGTVNLQERSFALARWRLREILFAWGDPPPEQLPNRHRRLLTLFALGVWIYRFFLFLGIALLVYAYFFKLLGIFLFCVEIGWFLVYPIYSEIAFWFRRFFKTPNGQRPQIHGHMMITGTLFLTFLTALFLPWMHTIEAPATLRAVHHTQLFAPRAARLETELPAIGHHVEKGDRLIRLYIPELLHKEANIIREIDLLRWQLSATGKDKSYLEQSQALRKQWIARSTELAANRKEQSLLNITAPFAAVVVERLAAAHPGEWMAEGDRLLTLVDPSESVVEAFVAGDYPGIDPHAEALFYPENLDNPPLPCQMLTLDRVNVQRLREPILASRFGGPILVREEQTEELIPREAYFRVTLAPKDNRSLLNQIVRGTVVLTVPPESPASRLWLLLSSLLLRESGF